MIVFFKLDIFTQIFSLIFTYNQNDNSLNTAESLNLIGLAKFYLNKFEESKLNLYESLQIYMNILENNDQNLMVAQLYESLALYHEYTNEDELVLDYKQKANNIKTLIKQKYEDF